MREYIITDKQLKTVTEAYLEHELSRPITDVFVSGDKLPEIVRCRDCEHGLFDGKVCDRLSPDFDEYWFSVAPDGFCAWGKRRAS